MIYSLSLDSLTVPSLPLGASPLQGAFATNSDGTHNRLRQTGTSAYSELVLPSGSRLSDWTMTCRIKFANIANPLTSFIIPVFQVQVNGDEMQLIVSRGTTETRGALWISKLTRSGPTVIDLGGPTYVGTSGTTFTQDEAYDLTIVASGTTLRVFNVDVQRVSDAKWLKSDGTWNASHFTALPLILDGSSPLNGIGNIGCNFFASVLDGYLYDATITDRFFTFTRQGRTTPVLSNTGTFDGWACDALGATGICYDGTRYVQGQSIWSVAQGKWAQGFWTSANMTSWAQVTGSLLTPSGGDYLFGNGAVAWWHGKYWLAYTHYHFDLTNLGLLVVDSSTDLLAWTHVVNPIATDGLDVYIIVNPWNDRLEVWYTTRAGAITSLHMWDSTDGVTFTDRGVILSAGPVWAGAHGGISEFSAPFIFYPADGARWCGFDFNPQDIGRCTGLIYSLNRDTNWLSNGMCLSPVSTHSWEAVAVLDNGAIIADLGDGYGAVPRLLYGGSDNPNKVDDTNSAIGLATWEDPSPAPAPGTGHFATVFAGVVR